MGKTKIKERKLGKVPPQEEIKKLPEGGELKRAHGSPDGLKDLVDKPSAHGGLLDTLGVGESEIKNKKVNWDLVKKIGEAYNQNLSSFNVDVRIASSTEEVAAITDPGRYYLSALKIDGLKILKQHDIQAFINTFLETGSPNPDENFERGQMFVAGGFLSGLIQKVEEPEIELDLSKVGSLRGVCSYFDDPKKKVTINGNVAELFGQFAKSGTIILNGDAETDLGKGICGAKIFVNGKTGIRIGMDGQTGEIHVNGKIDGFNGISENINNVKVTENGEKLWPP